MAEPMPAALAPEQFSVTHPEYDAPDGAVLFLEEHGATYKRVRDQWIRVADDASPDKGCYEPNYLAETAGDA